MTEDELIGILSRARNPLGVYMKTNKEPSSIASQLYKLIWMLYKYLPGGPNWKGTKFPTFAGRNCDKAQGFDGHYKIPKWKRKLRSGGDTEDDDQDDDPEDIPAQPRRKRKYHRRANGSRSKKPKTSDDHFSDLDDSAWDSAWDSACANVDDSVLHDFHPEDQPNANLISKASGTYQDMFTVCNQQFTFTCHDCQKMHLLWKSDEHHGQSPKCQRHQGSVLLVSGLPVLDLLNIPDIIQVNASSIPLMQTAQPQHSFLTSAAQDLPPLPEPAQNVSAQDASAQDASAQDLPPLPEPAQDVSAQNASAQDLPPLPEPAQAASAQNPLWDNKLWDEIINCA